MHNMKIKEKYLNDDKGIVCRGTMTESEIYKLRDFTIGAYRTCLLVRPKKSASSSRYEDKGECA